MNLNVLLLVHDRNQFLRQKMSLFPSSLKNSEAVFILRLAIAAFIDYSNRDSEIYVTLILHHPRYPPYRALLSSITK